MKRLSLSNWIFLSMAVGVALGVWAPGVAVQLAPVSNVFLRLIKSIIAPLLFGTLVGGIASTGSIATMGRIGIKAIIYFEVATTMALFIGLGAVNLVRPGAGIHIEQTAVTGETLKTDHSIGAILEH